MVRREYTVRFLTPAFLGNAKQAGQWRTPPFKALLRQWWRVVWAAERGFTDDVDAMRRAEGVLFGTAAGEGGRRSEIRLRLDRWDLGRQRTWPALPKVRHPEVGFPIDAGLYLGYGPVELKRGQKQPTLKRNAAIQADETARLRLAFPEEAAPALDGALALVHRFGALGGRSRNGWGSLVLEPEGETPAPEAELPLRNWREALDRDWPHAVGRDERGPLLWRMEPARDWQALMRRLAEVKIGLRTQFRFPSSGPHPRPVDRHWLAYPIARKHQTRAWKGGARLPNSLRFRATRETGGRLRGIVFHVPCRPPRQFEPDRSALERVWRKVHEYLDREGLERAGH